MQNLRESRNLNFTAIIPAYNEGQNILDVLERIKQVPAIQEIMVVSDGSTDNTVNLVREFGGVKVITLPQNLGKTKAVMMGILEAKHSTILLCDADLVNLNQNHLVDLINKYQEGFEMVIMDKGSQPWVFRHLLKSVPAVSGTRILGKKYFLEIPFLERDRFQLEIRINDFFIEHELSIAIVPAPEIYDLRKYVKYPFLRGLVLDIKGGLGALASDGPRSIIRNLRTFRKIKALA